MNISEFFANLPHALYTTTHPSIIQILIYYAILLLIIFILKTNFENKKVIISTILLSLILYLSATIKVPNNNFEVISFDVGNADAFLLKTPKDKYYIIDTGKMPYDNGKSQAEIIILKYLKDKGIKNIEGLIITHYDSDHAGGAIDLINNLKVKKVYVNTLYNRKRLAKVITETINSNPKTVKVLATNGDVISKEPDFELKIIRPNLVGTKFQDSDNENSILILASYGKNKMLFTGDAGVKALHKADLPQNITVFKTGHHGAKGVIDKELMKTLNPKASIVSVGFNKYGHPSPITIRILETSKVFRTDKMNALKICFKRNNYYEIDGYNPKTHKFYKRFSGNL